ncbi:MAG: PQQ-binding-like beta-propeller repeat protein [Bacteroidia bacterium]|nr:PQQ-binding-like beta-propeller repeat protein [Bacteroidia bacterium]
MIKEKEYNNSKARFWKSVLIIAGVFSFALCILIIGNYFQINKADPVNTKVINTLVERLNQNPGDQALRNEIREFDLLARKAYFTNQWQIRFGGYLLLFGIIVMVIAVLMMDSTKNKVQAVTFVKDDKLPNTQRNARKWITIGGLLLAVITLIFAFLSHNELGNKFSQKDSLESNLNLNDSLIANSNIIQNSDTLKINSDTAIVDTSKTATLIEFPTAAMMSNFPSFRGPGGNGIDYHKNIPTSWDGASGKNIKWKTTIPLPGYNSPVVWGEKVFLTGANGTKQQVYCFDKKSGNILWTADVSGIDGSPSTAPKVTDDTGYSAPTVTTDGEKVYAIFATGDIIALDMKGNKVWARNIGVPANHYGHSSSLMLFENKIIVQFDQNNGAKVMALSTQSGKTIWSTPRKVKISWASPVIVNTGSRVEILLIAEPYVASYDPSTGKELWKIDCTSGEVGPSVAYANGIVFALNEYAKLVAIQIGDQPKILWENNDYLSDVPSPVANDKYLFVVTSYGEVACYNPKTGDKYWNHEFGTGTYSSPILIGERVYLMDKKGTMHIFKADKTFSSVGDPKLGENTVSTPAFADGKIFVRAGNNLYCIGK